MTPKAKNLTILAVSVVTMLAFLLTMLFSVIIPSILSHKSDAITSPTSYQVSASPLIKSGGVVDPVVLSALLGKVGALESSSSTTQKHMGQINGGNPVTVKLFDTVSTTTNNINLLTAKYWQPVYRTGNILTLWMVEPYTTAAFDGTSPYTKVYSESPIRDLINSTYDTLNTTFNLNNKNFVATPNDLPVKWQTLESEQPNTTKYSTSYNAENNRMTGCETDKLWLPSYAEVINNTGNATYDGTTSLWKTTQATRAYTNNSTSDYAWLRSALLPVLA